MIKLYVSPSCTSCRKAKSWLEEKVIYGGIAFWGTLDFPLITTAIHSFYDEVFRPLSRKK